MKNKLLKQEHCVNVRLGLNMLHQAEEVRCLKCKLRTKYH